MRHITSRRAFALRFSLIVASILTAGAVSAAETIVGRATVTDGDTLEIRGTRIRLHGVDAPESAQLCSASGKEYRCGQKAANALSDKIGSANVSCLEKDKDRYGRTVAVCSVNGEEVNRWLVSQGHALAYRQYGGGVYSGDEASAKKAQRGIWSGSFEAPWDWRRHKRAGGTGSAGRSSGSDTARNTASSGSSGDCQIKGNIGSSGDKIYHVPGSGSYTNTKIDTAKGERMFCSEADAKAAGWRAPQ